MLGKLRCFKAFLPGLLGLALQPNALSAHSAPLPSPAAKANPNAQEAAKELERIRQAIRGATEAVQTEAAHRDVAAQAVRQADQSLKKATRQYDSTRQARAQSEKRRAQLALAADQARAELADRQSRLAEFVRAAQASDHSDTLALLMNGESPARQSRLLDYFGYIGNVRAEEIKAIDLQARQLQELEEQLSTEVKRLSDLEEETKARTLALDKARAERKHSLDQLTNSVANRTQQLKDLKANAQALENLIERLNRVVRQAPSVSRPTEPGVVRGAFGRLRGQLPWPVSGKVLSHFGDERIGGLRWTGMLFETHSQSDVHAAAAGRVIYSDWLPGLGQLVILDHGSGYLSLYGYNDALKRAVGDQVQAGDVIASTAQSDSGQSKLYFEIRDGGKPVDPASWLSRAR